ncbi:MAG: LytTR family DNA-binding domain-containing protein [Solobacterium sp.]|jgi:DNA-binding LytR/AlgR family response regulator|nr:LytTR family DNA-binding domain-containing protein [Solobacterium sp.]MCH4206286.1 LytTR family DNA-binding domain-containing protein [Solobacterium sp.]MCH4227752.1 LytTR family DNA-binding domain-containing protein [Solobacterium sp.]MCH4283175.1 LytTR family DNA-binding domain-containing protein [Solobacterium sp.]
MKIAVCDDERIQLDLMSAILAEYRNLKDCPMEVSTYIDADTLWWDIQDGRIPDLILLDIQMEKTSGIELAHKICNLHLDIRIAFVTGIKDYVFEGYDVNAIGYILKPFEKDQIFHLLNKAYAGFSEIKKSIVIKNAGELLQIYIKDIIALEAVSHDTELYLCPSRGDQRISVTLHKGLNECIEGLQIPSVIKTHRSYAVNMNNIVSLQKDACRDAYGNE